MWKNKEITSKSLVLSFFIYTLVLLYFKRTRLDIQLILSNILHNNNKYQTEAWSNKSYIKINDYRNTLCIKTRILNKLIFIPFGQLRVICNINLISIRSHTSYISYIHVTTQPRSTKKHGSAVFLKFLRI